MNKFIKIISVLLIFSTINACMSQRNMIKNNPMEQLLNSDFEKLDINGNELLTTKSRYGTSEPPKYIVHLNKIINNVDIETFGQIDVSYDQWSIPKEGWFKIHKKFYNNGNIKSKRIYNKTSYGNYGKMYEFDEQGNLIKTTDFDKGWTTSFEMVTEIAGEYAKKYKFKVETAIDGEIKDDHLWKSEYVKIWRKENEGKKYWIIGFNKAHFENQDNRKTERLVILIDDTTGNVRDENHYFDWYNTYFKDPMK